MSNTNKNGRTLKLANREIVNISMHKVDTPITSKPPQKDGQA